MLVAVGFDTAVTEPELRVTTFALLTTSPDPGTMPFVAAATTFAVSDR